MFWVEGIASAKARRWQRISMFQELKRGPEGHLATYLLGLNFLIWKTGII